MTIWNPTAIADGRLTRDNTLLDATSGNTGIAYAMNGAALEYRVAPVMPANVSDERKKIVRAFGAELILSDPLEGSDRAIVQARELAREVERGIIVVTLPDGGDRYAGTALWG